MSDDQESELSVEIGPGVVLVLAFVLLVLCLGEPDLLDAIVSRIYVP